MIKQIEPFPSSSRLYFSAKVMRFDKRKSKTDVEGYLYVFRPVISIRAAPPRPVDARPQGPERCSCRSLERGRAAGDQGIWEPVLRLKDGGHLQSFAKNPRHPGTRREIRQPRRTRIDWGRQSWNWRTPYELVGNQKVICIVKRCRILTVVKGMRPCVIGVELDVLFHAMAEFYHKSVIAGIYAAEDIRNVRVIRINPVVVERCRIRGCLDRPMAAAVDHVVGDCAHVDRVDICIDKIGRMPAKTPKVRQRKNRVPTNLLLDRKIYLVNLRIFEIAVEEQGARLCASGSGRGQRIPGNARAPVVVGV